MILRRGITCMRNVLIRKYHVQWSADVKRAVVEDTPVVALESTVITHGLPYPENLRTARSLEKIIYANGCTPATIAVRNGTVHVGMEEGLLTELASENRAKLRKISRRDLSYSVAEKLSGGTTVSGTMLLAEKAGIQVFATGGVGGVHRGGQASLDISADLTELGRTRVAVVCAGVKSVLDIGRTLEFLETQGVCVCTIGETNEFPSFFSRSSGHYSPCHVPNAAEAAKVLKSHLDLGLQSGILFAVPIPVEHELSVEDVERWLKQALSELRETGKDVTPFLLKRLTELSDGATLKANVALLENNAKMAAQIAVHLKALSASSPKRSQGKTSPSENVKDVSKRDEDKPILCIGGSVLDIMARCSTEFQADGATHPGTVLVSPGGVARNVSDALSRLGCKVNFLSAIGDDEPAQLLLQHCNHLDLSHVLRAPDAQAACYVGLLNQQGQLAAGIMNMEIHERISPEYIWDHKSLFKDASMVLLDGNVTVDAMDMVMKLSLDNGVPVWYEPTDPKKAHKIFEARNGTQVTFLSPNIRELHAVLDRLHILPLGSLNGPLNPADHLEMMTAVFQRLPLLDLLAITQGPRGVLLISRTDFHESYPLGGQRKGGALFVREYQAPAVEAKDIVSVSGSGDCFTAGMIAGIKMGYSLDQAAELATSAAASSLRTHYTVPQDLGDILRRQQRI